VIVRRFFDTKLAQASYLIACGKCHAAIVIDPLRDTEQYVRAAAAEGVAITHVTETHIHADFVSGARDLARGTGATLLLSDEGDADWKYAYATADGARLVKDGDTVMIGNVRVTVVHTPGHTPEHISFLITDTAVADEPIGIVTGDFVFVGDVGRPDLLEKAAKVAGSMEASARTLYRSLQKFKQYPDWLQVWPGHGAGSACGKGLSAVPHSTVGYEKRFNWAFSVADEDTFVRSVLEGQPEPPKYFAEMKRINKAGPAPYDPAYAPATLSLRELQETLTRGATVVDTRARLSFAEGHIPGTISIPLATSFSSWAGWLLPYDADIHLIAEDARASAEAARELAMIGIDRVRSVFHSDVIAAWVAAGGALDSVRQMTAAEVEAGRKAGTLNVIDVRWNNEWKEGHLPDTPNIPLGHLQDQIAKIDASKPVVLHCQGGGRSSIGAGLLQAAGIKNVANMDGGFDAWESAALPIEKAN
jgi:hydroxyacylglutathione hydrolase